MELEAMTDDELDGHRRAVLTEQERRQKLARGLEAIGAQVCDYLHAAGHQSPDGEHAEIGRDIIDQITGEA